MAPKRGDTKTEDGKKYRYAYKDGKLMWVRDYTRFNPKIGKNYKPRAEAKVIKDNTIYNSKGRKTLVNGDEVLFKESLINDLAIEFKSDNCLFNRDKFIDACE